MKRLAVVALLYLVKTYPVDNMPLWSVESIAWENYE
jgi:hypothetical protein